MENEPNITRGLPADMYEKERELFTEWRSRQTEFCSDGQFIEDGVVHYSTYAGSHPKLLFLLKEPNDPPRTNAVGRVTERAEWNLAVWLGEGGWHPNKTRGYKSWEVIARWTHDITTTDGILLPWPVLEADLCQHNVEGRANQFRKIAVVNIKKSGGAGSTQIELLFPEIERTKDLILSQISLYRPSIVICGGTFDAYRTRIAAESQQTNVTARGVRWYLSRRIGIPVVDYPHYTYFPRLPPAIKPAMHYGLVEAVRQILTQTDV